MLSTHQSFRIIFIFMLSDFPTFSYTLRLWRYDYYASLSSEVYDGIILETSSIRKLTHCVLNIVDLLQTEILAIRFGQFYKLSFFLELIVLFGCINFPQNIDPRKEGKMVRKKSEIDANLGWFGNNYFVSEGFQSFFLIIMITKWLLLRCQSQIGKLCS